MKWVALISTTLLVGITQAVGKDPKSSSLSIANFNVNVSNSNFNQKDNVLPKQSLIHDNRTFFDVKKQRYFRFDVNPIINTDQPYQPSPCTEGFFKTPKFQQSAYYISTLNVYNHGPICSCSSLSRVVLITAANCVYGKTLELLRVEMKFKISETHLLMSKHKLKKYYVAPDYTKEPDINDVALLVLKPPYPEFPVDTFRLPTDIPGEKNWLLFRQAYNVKVSDYVPIYDRAKILPLSQCENLYKTKYNYHYECVKSSDECFFLNSLDVGMPLAVTVENRQKRILYAINTGTHIDTREVAQLYLSIFHLELWMQKILKTHLPV